MQTCFIIGGYEMHPHEVSDSILFDATEDYVSLTNEMNCSDRSVVNLMREEIFGLTDYTFVMDGTRYQVRRSHYTISNCGGTLYEKLFFVLRGGYYDIQR